MRIPVFLALLAGTGLSLLMGSLKPSPQPRESGEGPAPQRVVCISPGLTEVICHLGAGSTLVGVDTFSLLPPELTEVARVGGAINPNLESILKLKPDLIVTQGRADKVRLFARRHGIATPAATLRFDNLADLLQAYDVLGLALGRTLAATRARRRLEADLQSIRQAVSEQKGRPRVFIALGHHPGSLAGLYTATAGTFLGQVVELAGGGNILGEAAGLWPKVSAESIGVRAPQVILEFHPGRELDTTARSRIREDWRRAHPAMPAVLTDRIHILTRDFLLLPGPRVVQTARILAALLHPEVAYHDW